MYHGIMRSAIVVLILCLAPFARADLSPDDALTAAADNTLPAFAKQVEDSLRRELTQKTLDNQAVIRLASLRVFARRLAAVKPATPEDAKTLEWLVKHPTLGPLLLTALSPRANPAPLLSAPPALPRTLRRTLDQFPALTLHTCVVPSPP